MYCWLTKYYGKRTWRVLIWTWRRSGNIRTRCDNGSASRYELWYNVFLKQLAPGAFTNNAHIHAPARSSVSPPALIRHRNYRGDLSRSIPSAGDSSLNVSLRTFDLARFFIAPALPAADRLAGFPSFCRFSRCSFCNCRRFRLLLRIQRREESPMRGTIPPVSRGSILQVLSHKRSVASVNSMSGSARGNIFQNSWIADSNCNIVGVTSLFLLIFLFWDV